MFKSYEVIKNSILENIKELDKREGSFVNDMVSPVSIEIESAYEEMKGILTKRFLVNETREELDYRADEYGLKRKPGVKASGTLKITGIKGTLIPKGSLFGTLTGLLFETKAESIIADESVNVDVEAVQLGDAYNIIANKVTEIPIAISGVISCTNEKDMTGGAEIETDEDLQSRLLMRIRNPSTSGNPSHYKEWALEVSGIGDARVIPLKDGNGTVTVIPVTVDKRSPNQQSCDLVAANIESKRPIGARVSIVSPREVSINMDAQISIDPQYTLEQITGKYQAKLNDYIKASVFKMSYVDYFKCLSLFYDVPGVLQVVRFTLNEAMSNIAISEMEIPVIGKISIS